MAWPAQAGQRTDGTYATQQTGGPTLGLCKAPAVKGSGSGKSSNGDRTSTGATGGTGSLAGTGTSRWIAIAGFGLLLAGGLLARRRFLG